MSQMPLVDAGQTRIPGSRRSGGEPPALPASIALAAEEDAAALERAVADLVLRLPDSTDDLPGIGREIARGGIDLLGELAAVWVVGPDQRTLDPLGSADRDVVRREQLVRLLAGPRPRAGIGLLGGTALAGGSRLVRDVEHELGEGFAPYVEFCRRCTIESILGVPLVATGRRLGVLALLRTAALPPFTDAEVAVAESYAAGAATRLERVMLLDAATRDAALLDALSPAVVATDLDRRITAWNAGAERLYGIPAAMAVGQRIDVLVPTDTAVDPTAPFVAGAGSEDDDRWHVVTHEGEWSGRVRQLAADGRVVHVELRMTLLAASGGRVTGGITLAREVASEDGDPIAPEFSHDSQSVIDALQSQLAVLDHQGRVVATNLGWEERCNEAAESLGAWVDAAPGNDYVTLLRTAGRTRPAAREALAGLEGVLGGRLGQFSMDYDASVEGDERFYGLTVAPLADRSGGAIVKHIDITWRKTLERQLSHRATHDALTGLPNRLLLHDRLTQALVRARRSGRLVAVMFVDLDQFKAVNDTLGHAAGDQVLVAVSRRLVRACRASDSVTRFGGDEFVLVVEDVDSLDNVRRIAQRVLDSMTTPIVVEGSELYFGASIGVAVTGGETAANTSQVEGLLRDADTAMYRAKESGRNTFVVFDPDMRARVANRLSLTTDLRHAISRDELRLLFQPQFDCEDDEIVGAEALVRWMHPERGMVPPVEFIEAAEESGIIVEIGAWVLDEACRQAALWQEVAPCRFTVHVNLSPRQLADANVVALVRHALARHGLDPSRLGLEITEGALMDDPEAAARTLEQLRDLGVQISVDDFGTGYSSLAYLQRFPVDTLKIDRFFVSRITEDAKTAALVRGIVGLADALGLGSVAEGVETPEQQRAVRELGCRSYQGFLRARPGVAGVVTGLLEEVAARHPVERVPDTPEGVTGPPALHVV
ncbi:MAG: EAL domain-containing protein [Candidatus Nanopelagicales bacterium]